MHGTLVVALNGTRITQDIYFEVPLNMVELIVGVLNKMLFSAKSPLLWHQKNNYVTKLMCLPVSTSNDKHY